MPKNIIIAVLGVTTVAMAFLAWTQKQKADDARALSIQNSAMVEQCLMEAQHQRVIAQHTLQMLKQAQDTIKHQVQAMKAEASGR